MRYKQQYHLQKPKPYAIKKKKKQTIFLDKNSISKQQRRQRKTTTITKTNSTTNKAHQFAELDTNFWAANISLRSVEVLAVNIPSPKQKKMKRLYSRLYSHNFMRSHYMFQVKKKINNSAQFWHDDVLNNPCVTVGMVNFYAKFISIHFFVLLLSLVYMR